MPIVLEDPTSNDSTSYIDISHIEGEQKRDADPSDSVEASSKSTTPCNSTPPNPYDTKSNTSGEAKLTEIYGEMEMMEARRYHSPLKHKARKTQTRSQSR
jgi:hypothetical protein